MADRRSPTAAGRLSARTGTRFRRRPPSSAAPKPARQPKGTKQVGLLLADLDVQREAGPGNHQHVPATRLRPATPSPLGSQNSEVFTGTSHLIEELVDLRLQRTRVGPLNPSPEPPCHLVPLSRRPIARVASQPPDKTDTGSQSFWIPAVKLIQYTTNHVPTR